MRARKAYLNGKVVTMNTDKPEASGFAILGQRFCEVGLDHEIHKWVDTSTEVVDLEGKTVIPGFIESHNHLSIHAMNLLQVNCSVPPNKTVADIKERIKREVQSLKPGQWALGYGYDDTLIADQRHLTRADLDEVSPDNPVQIFHISAHFSYVNSAALKVANIGPDACQPEGGEILMDEKNVPTGLLIEPGAMNLVRQHVPLYSTAQIKPAMQEAVKEFHRAGITSIHDGGIGFSRHGRQVLEAYQNLARDKKLKLRVYMTIIKEYYRDLFNLGLRTGFGSDMLKIGSVKTWQDGSIQGYTGALMEPYHSKPEVVGELLIPQQTLEEFVDQYHRAGCQIAIHANGDRAIESTLQAFEAAAKRHPNRDNRHMIIHCQLASEDHIKRMKKLGVVPNYFVNHVYYWGDRHETIFLGPERARRIDPLNTTIGNGLRFCLHSDLPVTPLNPLFSIHTAVNRITREGHVLGPEERIPVLEALKAYTINAAYCSFEENIKGTIEPGKLADFVILSDNPLEVSPQKIKGIDVLQTAVAGDTVFERSY